jgi:phage N-6-adenine-methyltransferase
MPRDPGSMDLAQSASEMSPAGRLLEGGSDEWYTPPEIFQALGLDFDLDPCTAPGGVPWVPARRHLSIEDDGLHKRWSGRVWLNPPYGTATSRWVERLARHGDGIALVFARTDTGWGQSAIATADAVCFIAGRLSFIAGAGGEGQRGHNAAAPSMLLAYGETCAAALRRCSLGLTFTADHLAGRPSAPTLWEAA